MEKAMAKESDGYSDPFRHLWRIGGDTGCLQVTSDARCGDASGLDKDPFRHLSRIGGDVFGPPVAFDDGEWDESKHPRDRYGKFTFGSGGGGGAGDPSGPKRIALKRVNPQEAARTASSIGPRQGARWAEYFRNPSFTQSRPARAAGSGGAASAARPAIQPAPGGQTTLIRAQTLVPAQQPSAPAQRWDRDRAIEHLQRNSPRNTSVRGECARYVGNAIEAGGIHINRALNNSPSGRSASGYGPVLESGGFRAMPAGTEPQAGDVVVIQPITGHPDGHAAMYDGQVWRSDFRQDRGIYPNRGYREEQPPYTLYRRP